jgi:hypothetical protein
MNSITTTADGSHQGPHIGHPSQQNVNVGVPHEAGQPNPVQHQLVVDHDADSPGSPSEEDGEYKKVSVTDAEKLKTGRRKINIEFIEDKSRRHITFSKRKAGIMKKAYELSTLTGTQVLLLVASETGHVYTFATPKLQPLITKPEGKNLIQSCLNAPEVAAVSVAPPHHQARIQGSYEPPIMYPTQGDMREPQMEPVYDEEKKQESKSSYPSLGGMDMNYPPGASYQSGNIMQQYSSPVQSVPRSYPAYGLPPHSQYSAPNQVQGQQYQQQPYSGGYPQNNIHGGMPNWANKGMQSMPIGQMSQGGQPSQTQASMSGIIQNKQAGGEHPPEHST